MKKEFKVDQESIKTEWGVRYPDGRTVFGVDAQYAPGITSLVTDALSTEEGRGAARDSWAAYIEGSGLVWDPRFELKFVSRDSATAYTDAVEVGR